MTVNIGGPLLDQLASYLFLLECDKCKILWLVVVGLVHGADDLGDGAELGKMVLNFFSGQSRAGKLADVNFPRLRLGFLAGDLLSL